MTGANVLKNATGYNLTQLMVAVKGPWVGGHGHRSAAHPLPAFDKLLFIPFPDATQACAAVSAVFRRASFPVPWNSWNVPLWNWYAGTIRS